MDYRAERQRHEQKLTALRRDVQLVNERIRHAHDEYHREVEKLKQRSDFEIKSLERDLDNKEKAIETEERSLEEIHRKEEREHGKH